MTTKDEVLIPDTASEKATVNTATEGLVEMADPLVKAKLPLP